MPNTPFATPDAATLTLEVTGLTNGTPYEVQVYAVNAQGNGNPVMETATPATVPAKMLAPILTAGNRQVTVEWTAPTTPTDTGGNAITAYHLRYKKG